MKSRVRGFTLVEIMVVIVIIGILMGLLLPAVLRSKDLQRMTECQSNLRQIGIGFKIYVTESAYFYPPATAQPTGKAAREWMDLIRPKMAIGSLDDGIEVLTLYKGPDWGKYKVFTCPANNQHPTTLGQFDFGYNTKCAGLNENTVTADMVVVHCANHYAPTPVNGKTSCPGIHGDHFDNFLYSDGHVDKSDSNYKAAETGPPWLAQY